MFCLQSFLAISPLLLLCIFQTLIRKGLSLSIFLLLLTSLKRLFTESEDPINPIILWLKFYPSKIFWSLLPIIPRSPLVSQNVFNTELVAIWKRKETTATKKDAWVSVSKLHTMGTLLPSSAYFISWAKSCHITSALTFPTFSSWGNLNDRSHSYKTRQKKFDFIDFQC